MHNAHQSLDLIECFLHGRFYNLFQCFLLFFPAEFTTELAKAAPPPLPATEVAHLCYPIPTVCPASTAGAKHVFYALTNSLYDYYYYPYRPISVEPAKKEQKYDHSDDEGYQHLVLVLKREFCDDYRDDRYCGEDSIKYLFAFGAKFCYYYIVILLELLEPIFAAFSF